MTAPVRAHQKAGRQTCELDGCSQPLYCRSLCVMHYSRLRKQGAAGPAERRRGPNGSGHVNAEGYRVLNQPDHPLAVAQGKVLEHRAVLFAALGPGPQQCHWCTKPLTWQGRPSERVCVDHLNWNRLDNTPGNLVASCLACNTQRQEVSA